MYQQLDLDDVSRKQCQTNGGIRTEQEIWIDPYTRNRAILNKTGQDGTIGRLVLVEVLEKYTTSQRPQHSTVCTRAITLIHALQAVASSEYSIGSVTGVFEARLDPERVGFWTP